MKCDCGNPIIWGDAICIMMECSECAKKIDKDTELIIKNTPLGKTVFGCTDEYVNQWKHDNDQPVTLFRRFK